MSRPIEIRSFDQIPPDRRSNLQVTATEAGSRYFDPVSRQSYILNRLPSSSADQPQFDATYQGVPRTATVFARVDKTTDIGIIAVAPNKDSQGYVERLLAAAEILHQEAERTGRSEIEARALMLEQKAGRHSATIIAVASGGETSIEFESKEIGREHIAKAIVHARDGTEQRGEAIIHHPARHAIASLTSPHSDTVIREAAMALQQNDPNRGHRTYTEPQSFGKSLLYGAAKLILGLDLRTERVEINLEEERRRLPEYEDQVRAEVSRAQSAVRPTVQAHVYDDPATHSMVSAQIARADAWDSMKDRMVQAEMKADTYYEGSNVISLSAAQSAYQMLSTAGASEEQIRDQLGDAAFAKITGK